MLEESRPKLDPTTQRRLIIIESSVLICMGAVILSGILGIYGAQKTFEAFEGNCIYTEKISFVSRIDTLLPGQQPATSVISTTTSSPGQQTIAINPTKFTTITQIPEEKPDEKTDNTGNNNTDIAVKPTKRRNLSHIFRILEQDLDETVEESNVDKESHDAGISRDQVQSEADYQFLSTMQVDIVKTTWASMEFCDYVLYNQVLSTIAGMICVTMLILYNSGGKAQLDWGIPKPWRIVFPAAISFGIMTIVGVVHLIIMNKAYDDFCGGLSNNLETKTVPCQKLINAFHPVMSSSTVSPGTHYIIHITTIRLNLIAWVAAFIIMVLRMLFVIDFRLVRVTVSTFAQKRKAPRATIVESSSSESNEEIEEKAKNLDKDSPKAMDRLKTDDASSKEDLDDFQSAHSDVEGVATHLSSLDPLLNNER